MSDHKPAARTSAFYWNTGEPSIFLEAQRSAANSAAGTKKVEKARAAGHEPATLYGLSRKSDELQAQRRKYSPPVEGREAGQRAGDKRASLRRGGI